MNLTVTPGRPLRDPATTDLSDLTASERTGDAAWLDETTLHLPFTPEPSQAEQALIRRRLMTRDAEQEAWVGAVVNTLAAIPTSEPCRALLALLVDDALNGIDAP